jgi:hypothetical protein
MDACVATVARFGKEGKCVVPAGLLATQHSTQKVWLSKPGGVLRDGAVHVHGSRDGRG